MKTLAILFVFAFFITGISKLSAQSTGEINKITSGFTCEMQPVKNTDISMLDKLQKETEEVSAMKPILFIVSIIEGRLSLRRAEKESIAAAKSRETGTR